MPKKNIGLNANLKIGAGNLGLAETESFIGDIRGQSSISTAKSRIVRIITAFTLSLSEPDQKTLDNKKGP
ncbi:hypothetical protein GCM10022277_34630 [Litoribacillus peritrichatus]|uniref:Uncharacterized protein n=1 Tax=Litoribacillus peritrichatus TaxID=718191 RepID=A0ABP7N2A2_9GAMM